MLLPFNRCSKTGTISIDAGGTIWSDVTGTSCVIYPVTLTFLLMLFILNVSQGSKETGLFAGIAIGGTVLLEAM